MKWNYLTISEKIGTGEYDAQALNNMLSQFGAEEWELVSIMQLTTDGSTTQANYIFKRLATANSKSEFQKIGFDPDNDDVAGYKQTDIS
jgi:hypothetical protein